jgi:hypothetical protein
MRLQDSLRALVPLAALVLLGSSCTADRAAEGESGGAADGWGSASDTRPVVDLDFVVSEDLGTVEGRERVEFTPDLDVCELVFRLWPNKPLTAVAGNALEVTDVLVDDRPARPELTAAGAPEGAPGTLLDVPLPSCVPAGTTLDVLLDFTLTLGRGTDERVGVARAGDVAWFGTAFPLLAWEDGRGWARDPAVRVAGEMATSETFRLRSLEVQAPAGYDVLGTGAAIGAPEQADGLTTHRFAAPAVRDVTVTVGRLEVLTRRVDGVRLHVGAPRTGVRARLEDWAAQLERSMREVADLLGPVPYEDVWVSVLPDQTDGIEFPGAIQFGDVSPGDQSWLVTHEVAHLWFHGLVGNNQARDPWLDESFATYVQLVVDEREPEAGLGVPGQATGQVGRPMSYWATLERPNRAYVRGVYVDGGAALLEARDLAGDDDFDAALAGYLEANAHSVAVPADVEAAFADLPAALQVLRRVGALADER